MMGTVTRYSRQVGWGFIRPDNDPDLPDLPDFFVHHSWIQAEKFQQWLRVGQRVEFDPVDIDNARQAKNVRKLPTLIARQVSDTVQS
jgi:cold shock CspA family protein